MKRFSPVISLVFFSFIVIFSACEVGLGEAVDTEAPKIAVSYPAGKSVIRDWFVLAGECSDDQSVAAVTVSVMDSEGNPVDCPFAAPVVEVSADGTGQVWSVKINEKTGGEYPLKDGKYTFCATATDGAGRKSQTVERQFEIDNTAPVFRINSPGSTETETAYGSVLKVEGEIAEAHSVKTMTLAVYGNDGTVKARWTEKDINTAGSTKVTFAKYMSGGEHTDDLLYNNYKTIYDIDKGGDQSFICSVMLTDSASVYQTPPFIPSARVAGSDRAAASGGNENSDVWLYDDIYGSDAEYMLMGTKAAEVWGKSFEMSDFMNLLNGTESYDATNSDGKTVLEVLEDARIDTAKKRLKIKLNKDANPTYTVMGYSFDDTAMTDGEWNISPAVRGGMLTLKADAGLDGVQFSPETIKVYLFGPFEQLQLSDSEAGILSSIYRDPELYAKENAERTAAVLYDGKNGVSFFFWGGVLMLADRTPESPSVHGRRRLLFRL